MAGYESEEQSTDAGQKKKTTGASVQVRPLDHAGRSESERAPQSNLRPWRPVSLRYPFLLGVLASTIGLIVVLQYLLARSQRDQGILFAKNINDLPISRTFGYTYGPTIVSVVFGLLWNWIDVDVKRLEPFFQLSKPDGALGKDSILLEYPFDFALAIPFKSCKRKHWAVLMSSTAVVLIFLGLTPTQAGIFAVRTITIEETVKIHPAGSCIPIDEQGNRSAAYAQSVYSIAWLNESLPPFMTKEYVLEPFGSMTSFGDTGEELRMTGRTMKFSVDVECETPTLFNNSGAIYANSSNGCSYLRPMYRTIRNNNTDKPFDTLYVGYSNENGAADYYLSSSCPESANQTFFVRFSKSSPRAITAPQTERLEDEEVNSTSLYCTSSYFRQQVLATVSLPSRTPLYVRTLGPKFPLPYGLFNSSEFEWMMNSGIEQGTARGPYPDHGLPDQKSHLQDMPLNLAYLPKMAPFAIAAHQLPMERYMDPAELASSYRKAYRLLFTRRLSDILGQQLNTSTTANGTISYATQSVVAVSGFVYAVIAMLALLACMQLVFAFYLSRRSNRLCSDPGSIGALMELTRGSTNTVLAFCGLDRSSTGDLHTAVSITTFGLKNSETHDGPRAQLHTSTPLPLEDVVPDRSTAHGKESPATGVRPSEVKVSAGATFLSLQLIAAIVFALLYGLSKRNNGLPLPSEAIITRQVLQNYMPVAFATLAEPFWLVLNRLLCMLQPYEQLRHGGALASRSVNLNYGCLPPQLMFWRAMRAKHYLLFLVCLVAVLMNALAVALSGVLYEDIAQLGTPTTFSPVYSAAVRKLNATGIPFNADAPGNSQGGTTQDQFYREISNITTGTPLPPWTDGASVWLPVHLPHADSNKTYRVKVSAFSASLDCQPLGDAGTAGYSLLFESDAIASRGSSSGALNVTIPNTGRSNSPLHCHDFKPDRSNPVVRPLESMRRPEIGRNALELGFMLSNSTHSSEDAACRQYIVAGWTRANWQYVNPSDGIPPKTRKAGDEDPKLRLANLESTILLCKPELHYNHDSAVLVDSAGFAQAKEPQMNDLNHAAPHGGQKLDFGLSTGALMAQANQFLVDNGATWHQDAFPSDWTNYLLSQHNAPASLLDYEVPPPTFEEIGPHLSRLYTRLFAILFSSNLDKLLEPAELDATVHGATFTMQTRIFVSVPALVVAECVLLLCMAATSLLYVRWRTWRLLPRLPSNVASTIAFFAASNALRDLDAGEHRCTESSKDWRWGFGYFIGADARRHVGIERAPLVSATRADGEGRRAAFL